MGNKTVLETTIQNILAGGIEELILVLGHEEEKIRKLMKDLPLLIVSNPDYGNGITSSIQQGVRKATGNGYMICLADMVSITPPEYELLRSAFQKQWPVDSKCICVARYQNQKGNPVIFSSHYREAILQHRNVEGCKGIVQANQEHIHWIDMPTNHVLMDLDYPADYEAMNSQWPRKPDC